MQVTIQGTPVDLAERGVQVDADREVWFFPPAEPDYYLKYEAPYKVIYYVDEPLVWFAGGRWALPERFYFVTLRYPTLPTGDRPNLTLHITVERGEMICDRFLIARDASDPRPITTGLLRALSPSQLVQVAGATIAHQGLGGDSWSVGPSHWRDDATADWKKAYADAQTPQRGKKLPDDHLRRVADAYRSALLRSEPPTKAVASALHASRSTAGRWVEEARRRGILDPAPGPGRRGERQK
jgi:hypothetical protein